MDANKCVEDQLLQHAPVYLTLFAVDHPGELTKREKRLAEKLIRIKAFADPEILHAYYHALVPVFADQLKSLVQQLPADLDQRRQWLSDRFSQIREVLEKVPYDYQCALLKSWKSFLWYISKSQENNQWEEFALPLVIDHVHHSHGHYSAIHSLRQLLSGASPSNLSNID